MWVNCCSFVFQERVQPRLGQEAPLPLDRFSWHMTATTNIIVLCRTRATLVCVGLSPTLQCILVGVLAEILTNLSQKGRLLRIRSPIGRQVLASDFIRKVLRNALVWPILQNTFVREILRKFVADWCATLIEITLGTILRIATNSIYIRVRCLHTIREFNAFIWIGVNLDLDNGQLWLLARRKVVIVGCWQIFIVRTKIHDRTLLLLPSTRTFFIQVFIRLNLSYPCCSCNWGMPLVHYGYFPCFCERICAWASHFRTETNFLRFWILGLLAG